MGCRLWGGERWARIEFYADHEIGWVARPRDGVGGFWRRGKFKKASNMNFGLIISCTAEETHAEVERSEDCIAEDEAQAYERCLMEVLEEDCRAWADSRIGIIVS